MVEEVRNHLREMLESGAIRPSQSTWCSHHAREEERWQLMFLHRLPTPECPYEEGFLPITPNTRGTRKLSRCQPLFLPKFEIWILADQDG